jgi:hypothetical protein
MVVWPGVLSRVKARERLGSRVILLRNQGAVEVLLEPYLPVP